MRFYMKYLRQGLDGIIEVKMLNLKIKLLMVFLFI